MQSHIRAATPDDAPAAKACIVAAFEPFIARIGKPPSPILMDVSAEIAAKHVWVAAFAGDVVGVLVQYQTELASFWTQLLSIPASTEQVTAKRSCSLLKKRRYDAASTQSTSARTPR